MTATATCPELHALSYGGGVNSTALAVLLDREQRGLGASGAKNLVAIFADTGAEWPQTYEYVEAFREYWTTRGHRFVVVRNDRDGPLGEYSVRTRMIPSRRLRFCTDRWKVAPIHRWLDAERRRLGAERVVTHIGIDAGEAHRARSHLRDPSWVVKRWLLVERDIDREGCERIIAAAGLPPARKSGCFFCPFQNLQGWRELLLSYPALWARAEQVEAAAQAGYTLRAGVALSDLRKRFISEQKAEADFRSLPVEVASDGEGPPCGCFDGAQDESRETWCFPDPPVLERKGSSKFRGVGYHKVLAKWRAFIWKNGRHKHLGVYPDEASAARAYNAAALELHGKKAKLNTGV